MNNFEKWNKIVEDRQVLIEGLQYELNKPDLSIVGVAIWILSNIITNEDQLLVTTLRTGEHFLFDFSGDIADLAIVSSEQGLVSKPTNDTVRVRTPTVQADGYVLLNNIETLYLDPNIQGLNCYFNDKFYMIQILPQVGNLIENEVSLERYSKAVERAVSIVC